LGVIVQLGIEVVAVDEHDEPVVFDQFVAMVPFHGVEMDAEGEVRLVLVVDETGARGDFRLPEEKYFLSSANRVGHGRFAFDGRKDIEQGDVVENRLAGLLSELLGTSTGDRLKVIAGQSDRGTERLESLPEESRGDEVEDALLNGTICATHEEPFFHSPPLPADVAGVERNTQSGKGQVAGRAGSVDRHSGFVGSSKPELIKRGVGFCRRRIHNDRVGGKGQKIGDRAGRIVECKQEPLELGAGDGFVLRLQRLPIVGGIGRGL
jgi:hypothetical protein